MRSQALPVCYSSPPMIQTYCCIFMAAFVLGADTAFAASGWDIFQEELASWEEEDVLLLRQSDAERMDDVFHSSVDLFPEEDADETTGNTLEEQRDNRISNYVSVEMGGKLIIFRDVPRSTWFAPYVRSIAEMGIVSGYRSADGVPLGLFGSLDNVTIEQIAKVMMLATGSAADDCSEDAPANATASGSWSSTYIACAERLSWTVFSDGTVDVRRNATRAEVIMTMMQAFGVAMPERTGDAFTDVTLSTQFGAAIEKAKQDGIVSGYADADGSATGEFGPQDPVTRAEFAKIVTLGMQVYRMR